MKLLIKAWPQNGDQEEIVLQFFKAYLEIKKSSNSRAVVVWDQRACMDLKRSGIGIVRTTACVPRKCSMCRTSWTMTMLSNMILLHSPSSPVPGTFLKLFLGRRKNLKGCGHAPPIKAIKGLLPHSQSAGGELFLSSLCHTHSGPFLQMGFMLVSN